ncbi:MAG: Uma2 family endonuclease [Candidatus Eremiobacteraeota bacterium]|nr:Uma2 family endonuclease [Candidatus Eremiobacteraeota bacterium]MCW5871675.1 Uma2 family endonuclease [Candidatus Eremiobacteraeota bacterium]
MNSLADGYVSPEDYLARERLAETKSEYFDGQVLAMSGGTPQHALIPANIGALLWPQLRKGNCRVYNSDLRVATPNGRRFLYPDLTVVCGSLAFHDHHRDTVTNPKVVFEVLSKSIIGYDCEPKFLAYQAIPSLQEYVSVHQHEPLIEHYVRNNNETWTYRKLEGLEAVLQLPTIVCSLPLGEVYLSVFQA